MAIKASQKAGIVGLSSIRRALRNAPDAIRKEVVKVIEESAAEVAEVERFMAPRSEGDLIQSITYVVSSDGLSAVVFWTRDPDLFGVDGRLIECWEEKCSAG